jgi:hypothetical protein
MMRNKSEMHRSAGVEWRLADKERRFCAGERVEVREKCGVPSLMNQTSGAPMRRPQSHCIVREQTFFARALPGSKFSSALATKRLCPVMPPFDSAG